MTTIVCVKWGDKYSSEEVNTVFGALRQYDTKLTFLCYTDDPSGLAEWIDFEYIQPHENVDGFWNKAFLFDCQKDKFRDDKMILLDIDMELVNDPFHLLRFKPERDKLHVIHAYWKSDTVVFGPNPSNSSNAWDMDINSSCVVWKPSEKIRDITLRFILDDPDMIMLNYKGFDRYLYYNHNNLIRHLPKYWFYSHKYGGYILPEDNVFKMYNGTR
jgi:hypothetical protein